MPEITNLYLTIWKIWIIFPSAPQVESMPTSSWQPTQLSQTNLSIPLKIWGMLLEALLRSLHKFTAMMFNKINTWNSISENHLRIFLWKDLSGRQTIHSPISVDFLVPYWEYYSWSRFSMNFLMNFKLLSISINKIEMFP